MDTFIDLTGKRFGRLVVIRFANKDKWRHSYWLCECDCKIQKIIYGNSLKSGNTKSCGCLKREKATKHNHARKEKKSKTYDTWNDMTQRCTNPSNSAYHNYGGRGIRVCNRWKKFENFLEDMGESPLGHQIDRINNNKGYSKSNCRWATKKQQARNRRTNHLITYAGKTQCLIEWVEELNINYTTLKSRLSSGWSIEKALTTPVRKC